MKGMALAIIATVVCLGEAAGQTIIDGSGVGIEASQVTALKQAFARELSDPIAAQLRRVEHPFPGTKFERKDVICGFVNAKNGSGAYVGFRGFTFSDKAREVTIYDPARADMLRLTFNYSDCPWSE